ncbi:MAG: DUF4417 domain-containing protein [Lachnospiraceae bacterium]|nr:DUF4417 domain-containing protein [Lachnospiraceae bacterium]
MLKTNIRKYDIFKLYYWHGATLVGKYKLPQVAPTQAIPHDVISFNERSGVREPEKHWIDFFIDDALFESFWNHPDVSFKKLKKFEGIITTDYSMLPEMLPGQIIWNCTRNRVMAYYLQQNGFNAIPVASWSSEEDFEWCLDGLPELSSIAVSSNGCMSSPYGKEMFLLGIKELQQKKKPSHIIVCGRHIDELDNYDNIIYYPCFSQRWKERAD